MGERAAPAPELFLRAPQPPLRDPGQKDGEHGQHEHDRQEQRVDQHRPDQPGQKDERLVDQGEHRGGVVLADHVRVVDHRPLERPGVGGHRRASGQRRTESRADEAAAELRSVGGLQPVGENGPAPIGDPRRNEVGQREQRDGRRVAGARPCHRVGEKGEDERDTGLQTGRDRAHRNVEAREPAAPAHEFQQAHDASDPK